MISLWRTATWRPLGSMSSPGPLRSLQSTRMGLLAEDHHGSRWVMLGGEGS